MPECTPVQPRQSLLAPWLNSISEKFRRNGRTTSQLWVGSKAPALFHLRLLPPVAMDTSDNPTPRAERGRDFCAIFSRAVLILAPHVSCGNFHRQFLSEMEEEQEGGVPAGVIDPQVLLPSESPDTP